MRGKTERLDAELEAALRTEVSQVKAQPQAKESGQA